MTDKFRDFSPVIDPSCYVSPSADMIGRIRLGRNSSVWNKAVLRGDVDEIAVGENSNLQDAVIVHTNVNMPSIIGNNVTVGHGAIIHGCRIADFCLIGMGAVLLDASRVGEHTIVAAGSVVPEGQQLQPGSVYMGIPAKRMRPVTDQEKQLIQRRAKEYVQLAAEYKKA